MKHKIAVPPSLTSLIERQSGVFTVEQAHGLGATDAVVRRLAREGHWHNVARGLWSTTPQPSWNGLAWGGVLLGGDGACIGGRAAAHLWDLVDQPDVIDIWTQGKRRHRTGPWQFRRGTRVMRREPPRVPVEDAVVECCTGAGIDGIVDMISRALASRRTTVDRLHTAAHAAPNWHQRGLFLQVLSETADGIESPLESRYLRDVEQAHGLPTGLRQRVVSQRTRTDVIYQEFMTLVELDGEAYHRGLAAHADMERDNAHRLLGLHTLRFGWVAVAGDPCAAALQVTQALQAGGWEGNLTSCRRCAAPR